jgi:hypothetical protein
VALEAAWELRLLDELAAFELRESPCDLLAALQSCTRPSSKWQVPARNMVDQIIKVD